MKVSILIPLYNSEKTLNETIQCALSQTWSDKEIIAVDDGSADNTLKIAQTFEPQGVRVISTAHRGASAARNLAFSHSSGDYIQFLDSDDLISDNKIKSQMDIAEKTGFNPSVLLTCGTSFFTESVITSEQVFQPVDRDFESPLELLLQLFETNSFISSHAFLTHRSLIDKVNGWNESLSANDDGEFFSRVINVSEKVIFDEESKAYYRKSRHGLSSQKGLSYVKSELHSLELISRLIMGRCNDPRGKATCSKIFNWFITEWYPSNKPVLKETERFMSEHDLKYYSSSPSRTFHMIVKIAGWRKALLLSEFISKLKGTS